MNHLIASLIPPTAVCDTILYVLSYSARSWFNCGNTSGPCLLTAVFVFFGVFIMRWLGCSPGPSKNYICKHMRSCGNFTTLLLRYLYYLNCYFPSKNFFRKENNQFSSYFPSKFFFERIIFNSVVGVFFLCPEIAHDAQTLFQSR